MRYYIGQRCRNSAAKDGMHSDEREIRNYYEDTKRWKIAKMVLPAMLQKFITLEIIIEKKPVM